MNARTGRRRLAVLLLLSTAAPVTAGAAPPPRAPAPTVAGGSLEQALLALRARGLPLVFASNVVDPELRVAAAPAPGPPRRQLAELLAPHGLAAEDGPGGVLVVVRRPVHAATSPAPAGAPDDERPLATVEEHLTVTPSRVALLHDDPVATVGLTRDEVLELPHLGDDFFRAVSLLPGLAAGDVSARFHVRGGRRDETLIRIDGQELYEAFHLQDYDDALSVVDQAVLGGSALMTGTFPALYGDRAAGVLDLRTSATPATRRFRLGVSVAALEGGASASHGRLGLVAALRRGTADLVGRLLDDEDPRFWDGFLKLELALSDRHRLAARGLAADDALDFDERSDGESKRFRTDYENRHGWLGLESYLAPALLIESAVSWARLERDRRGAESEEEGRFAVRDRRRTEIRELRQTAFLQAPRGHALDAGWSVREYDSELDYLGDWRLDDPLAVLRHDGGQGPTSFAGRLRERHTAAHVSDRCRPFGGLTVEAGLRYDRGADADDRWLSPRLDLAWAVSERSILRLGGGRYVQSQRSYELALEDGQRALAASERSDQVVAGYERLLARGRRGAARTLRLEVYRRDTDAPRARAENLFERVNTFPEAEPARVLLAPTSSRATGAELLLRSVGGERFGGWIGYTWARAVDRIAGADVPRLHDQRHSLALDLDGALGARWRLNAAWRWHSGWPTTAVFVDRIEEGGEIELVPRLGRLNGERLPPYHRLDLRLSRRTRWRGLDLHFFVDVQNLYDRRNVAGYDLALDEDSGLVERAPEQWPGLLASVGLRLEL